MTSIASGGGLQLYGGAAWTTGGNLTNAGTLYVYDGSALTVAGTLDNTGGYLRIAGSDTPTVRTTLTATAAAPSVV